MVPSTSGFRGRRLPGLDYLGPQDHYIFLRPAIILPLEMICRWILQPDGEALVVKSSPEMTYEEALLIHGINPDTVLVLYGGRSLPVDKMIEEEEVEILFTCSRG